MVHRARRLPAEARGLQGGRLRLPVPREEGEGLMPWFKVDDTLSLHAKTVEAGNAAMGLWVRAGSWSMQQLTDGFIPGHIARQLGTRTEARRLVAAGLWDEKDDGYVFHEWDQRQPSRTKVMADREANANRVKNWRQKKREDDGETDV
jgi:hypothetical protein